MGIPTSKPTSSRTTAAMRRVARGRGPELVVHIVHSPDPDACGRVLRLDGARYVLGRGAEVAIRDDRMSRRHCELVTAGGGVGAYKITDLGSRNGTFLAGQPIEDDYLVPNAVIRVGDTFLVVDAAPPAARYPAARGVDGDEAAVWVGSSLLARAIRRTIVTIACGDGPILLLGPTGAGKEVAASIAHCLSGRSGPFVPVNCGAIAPNLAESELFGHVRGASTGAKEGHTGHFARADRGTLFLDEIGDMPLDQQVKLLRALETRTIQAVGAQAPRAVDVRVIAATNARLDPTRFREDLEARLAEWVIELPAVAERRADIVGLFAARLAACAGPGPHPGLTPEWVEAMLLYDWPRNVREIDKLARRTWQLAPRAEAWDLDLMPEEIARAAATAQHKPDAPDRAALVAALEEARGVVQQVARKFGRDRTQVYRWMRRYDLEPEQFR